MEDTTLRVDRLSTIGPASTSISALQMLPKSIGVSMTRGTSTMPF